MSGGRTRKLVAAATIGAVVAAMVKVLRGDPAPAFSNHPTVDGGRRPTPPAWVEPTDATCPEGYPVKAKLKSGIFHLPGMLAYDRTNPDRCYRSAEAATADGLRPAKR